jgi:predicted acylesterase/phospholipase RssA
MPTPLRVLSIDGGGIRGVYTAAYLAGLIKAFSQERKTKALDLGKGFDLIVGTSTGAIIGCAAAIGLSMPKVVKMYCENAAKIFPARLYSDIRVAPQLFTRSHYLRKGSEALRAALTSILHEVTIAQLYDRRKIAMAIPAVEMSQQRGWVFKTAHLNGHRDDNFQLVDVCLASSAAPIYRSLATIEPPDGLGGNLVFADGGLWANNPILVGLLDALKMTSDRSIEIFAVGTIPRPEGEQIAPKDVHRGLWKWKLGGSALELSIAAQEFTFDNMARLLANTLTDLGRPVKILRFPTGKLQTSVLPYLDIDDTRKEAIDALISQARADVNLTKSACDDPRDTNGQLIRSVFSSLPELPEIALGGAENA